jgi:hypothetical protein
MSLTTRRIRKDEGLVNNIQNEVTRGSANF